MPFDVKTELTEVTYELIFKDIWLESNTIEIKHALVKKLLKTYDLRLNDLRFNRANPSDQWISFSKFYGDTFFDVRFGIEQILVSIRRVQNEKQIIDLLTGFYDIIRDQAFKLQSYHIVQHMGADDDVNIYLGTIIQNTPSEITEKTIGRGISYRLQDEEKQMEVHFSINNSAFLQNGIYLSFRCLFTPNLYDFETAYKIGKTKYKKFTKAFKLNIDQNER